LSKARNSQPWLDDPIQIGCGICRAAQSKTAPAPKTYSRVGPEKVGDKVEGIPPWAAVNRLPAIVLATSVG
jgi:hypothetical protein